MVDYSFNKGKSNEDLYTDTEGCYWEDSLSWLYGYRLGLCTCGRPEDNLAFIYKLLLLKKLKYDSDMSYEYYYKELKKLSLNNWESLVEIVLNFLNETKKPILEHGTSVGGSWIDDEEFFNDLELWYKNEYLINKENT